MDSLQTPRRPALVSDRRWPLDTGAPDRVARWLRLGLVLVALVCGACQGKPQAAPAAPAVRTTPAAPAAVKRAVTAHTKIKPVPFDFQVSAGADHYQIEGFLVLSRQPGRLPAVLVLNGDKGNARRCIDRTDPFAVMGVQVACISLPGYGKSSGPSRFVGEQSVAAARHALDLLVARPDVDPTRLAVWGLGDGAIAAGLLMDSDPRLRAVILQSGAYDMLKLWPEAPLRTKLSILRQVWPSKRVLRERSVIEHLPNHLDCSVLILHGARDHRMPIVQAEQLAQALADRGAHVETHYFPKASHELGQRVDLPLRHFLRDNLIDRDGAAP